MFAARARLLVLLLLLAPLRAQETPLPVDPSITIGELPNGLRYWIRPNGTPAGKVSMILHVHSGSLNETDDQRGLAHFLEHMAFNGSENFPPGEMVKFFESLGMQFGQHQNAFTGFDQTSYMMHLPDAKAETIDKAFLYFADVGWRLLLTEEEIEKERGVILEEARSRKGARQRVSEKALPIVLPGSRIPERLPIGLETVIREAKRDRFVSYYRAWYRPDNATLIVCGDVEPEPLRARIADAFGAWKAPAGKPEPAAPGIRPHTELRASVLTDPELTQARVGLGTVSAHRPVRTVADFRRDLVDAMGTWIVNRRLRQRIQTGDAPFQGADVSTGDFLHACHSSDIDASGEPARWADMLVAVLAEVKRAREHGFRDAEIELARTSLLSGAEQQAQAEPTRNTTAVLMALNGAVTENRKPMSAAQALELTRRLLPTIDAKEALARFRGNFPLDRGIVMATLPEKDGVATPSDAELLAVAKKALAADVEKRAEEGGVAALLERDPEPAKPLSRSVDEALGVETVLFPNGARVHCRSMDYQKDRVMLLVRFVGGPMDETAKTVGSTRAASLALSGRTAATRRHSSAALSDLMTGKKITLGGGPDEGGLMVMLGGTPEDLEFGMRLLHVLLTEPKIEEVALESWKRRFALRVAEREKSARFQAESAVEAFLGAADPRVLPLSPERAEALDRDALQAWLDDLLATAPLEASFVGDLPRDRMVELAGRWLGTLPKRAPERDDLARVRRVREEKGPFERAIAVDTITPRAEVRLGWRGPILTNRADRRVLLFASQILDTRLNAEIREKRGLTYSIQSAVMPGDYDGMGRLAVVFTADPAKAEEAANVARAVVEGMREKEPPTAEEIAAVKSQIANILSTQLQQPGFWSRALSTLHTNGRTLAQLRTLKDDYLAVTKEQIEATLARYVTDERFYRVIAAPK